MGMKIKSLLLTCVAPLLLSGCDFLPFSSNPNEEKTNETANTSTSSSNEGTTQEGSQSGTSGEGQNNSSSSNEGNQENNQPSTPADPTTPVTPVDPQPTTPTETEDPDGTILRIYFSEAFYSVKSSKTINLTVEIEYAAGYNWDNCDDDIEWSTVDTSVATISKYGIVTGQTKGSTIVKAHMKNNDLWAEAKLFVINSDSDIEKTWTRMGAGDHIEEKDTIIIACPQEGKAATSEYVGHKLHSTDITFSSDKSEITDASGAAKFYVYSDYKGRGGYNVELLDGDKGQFLHASNTENVWFYSTAKASSSRWSIDWDSTNSCWDMRPATNVDGWMMYNKDIQQFANYQSNETARMFVVTLYRLTYTFKV